MLERISFAESVTECRAPMIIEAIHGKTGIQICPVC